MKKISLVRFIMFVGIMFSATSAQAAPFAYITNQNEDSVSVVDTALNTVTATITVGNNPFGVAVTPNGDFVYVTNSDSGTVSVVDTATNLVTATIMVGANPRGVAVTPNGAFVYVGNSDNISVIDTSTNTVTATIHGGSSTAGIAVTPDGAFVYVTSNYAISVIDTSTNIAIASVSAGFAPLGIAVTPDGNFMYVANMNSHNVLVIDTTLNTVVATIPVGSQPAGIAVTPDGNFVYVTNNVSGTVSVVDTISNTVVATIPTGESPIGVAVTPDGNFVYVVNHSSQNVSVIDTSTNMVVTTIPTGSGTTGFGLFIGPMPNQAPILDPIGNKTANEGETLTFALNATDADGNTLTYSASNLPAGATFDTLTGVFSWTPSYNQSGNYADIEFTVTDNGTPMQLDSELITITVGNVNRPPVFVSLGSQEVSENQPLTFSVSATDPDGDAVALSATNLPAGAVFDAGTATFSWTPNNTQSGVYVVTFVALDNGSPAASSTLEVPITVGDVPTPVEQADNLVTVVINATFSDNVENSYLANLRKIAIFIEDGKVGAAINQLNAFIQKVQIDISHGIITQTEGNELTTLANTLLADLQ